MVMKKIISIIVIVALFVVVANACHRADYIKLKHRKKRQADGITDQYTLDLINYFTDCMENTPGIVSLDDWYSPTYYTIADTKWYLELDTQECSGFTLEQKEAECWINNLIVLFPADLSSQIEVCIYAYANIPEGKRKKRQSSFINSLRRAPSRTTPATNRANPRTRPPRTSFCPNIPQEYFTELMRLVPPDSRSARQTTISLQPQESESPDAGYLFERFFGEERPEIITQSIEETFNITSVAEFVDSYTVCRECRRYSGESGISCFTDRFDRLTRNDSPLKPIIQQLNARYAGGNGIVGDCEENVYKTQWFDIDSPSGLGDYENFTLIRQRYSNDVCADPSGIEGQLVETGEPYGRGNNNLTISPNRGLFCRNRDQIRGRNCRNYRVRFCCKDFVGNCTSESKWTQYYSSNKPMGRGEFELLSRFMVEYPGRVCSAPTAIAAKVVSTNVSYQLTNDRVRISPTLGLICLSSLESRRQCNDYKVRYCCSPIIGQCSSNHTWTEWYDSPLNRIGDFELWSNINRQYNHSCLSNPSAIRAEVSRTRRPYFEGNNRLTIDLNGLNCTNSVQGNAGRCRNYRVSFCCLQLPKSPKILQFVP